MQHILRRFALLAVDVLQLERVCVDIVQLMEVDVLEVIPTPGNISIYFRPIIT